MEKHTYRTSDLKLQAFLRLMSPQSFVGAKKFQERVQFLFTDSTDLQRLVSGYYTSQSFQIQPFQFATLIDQGKSIIFGRTEFTPQ